MHLSRALVRAPLQARGFRLFVITAEIFPASHDRSEDCDYAEPRGPRASQAYAREHAEIFEPMRRLFALVREIATGITHEVGAFG